MSTKLSGKALVIQLTRDHIRVAKMQLGAKAQVLCCTKLDMPAGAVEDGAIMDMSALTEALKTALAAPDFKGTRRTVFALCTTQAISEKISVPAASGQKLDKTIDANMDMYFPVAVSDYQITRQELGRSKDENNNENIIMQLWAIPKAMLAQYYALAAACGLNVLAIDYCGHSHVRVSGATFNEPKPVKEKKQKKRRKKLPEGDEPNVEEEPVVQPTKVHILAEPEMMVMTFVRDGRVQMQRSFLCGYDIDSALGEAMMVIDYYRSLDEAGDGPMDLVLCGSLSEEPFFDERVERALLIPTHIQESVQSPGWCNCIGAAQSELDFGSVDLTGKKDKKKGLGSAWHYGAVLIGGAAAVGSILLLMVSKTTWETELTGLRDTEMMLRIQMAQGQKAAEEYSEYSVVYQNFSSDWTNVFASLRTYNDNMVLILQEIEELLPSETFVESIGIQAEGMSLQFSCPDKEQAAYLIMALREMKYATLESISNLSGTTGKIGRDDVEAPPTEGSSMMDMMQDAIDKGLITEDEVVDIYMSLDKTDRNKLTSGNLSQAEMFEIFEKLDDDQQKKLMTIYMQNGGSSGGGNSSGSGSSGSTSKPPVVLPPVETLISRATLQQRKDAIDNMLSSDPMSLYKFYNLLKEDIARDPGTTTLYDIISDDLWTNQKLAVAILSQDAAQVLAATPELVTVLTKTEKSVAATEKLMIDGGLGETYAYYLAIELGLVEEDEDSNGSDSDGDIDWEDIANGGELPPGLTWEDVFGGGGFGGGYGEPEVQDDRIHFSVSLAYSENLINAELERKGFISSEMPAMLEVE